MNTFTAGTSEGNLQGVRIGEPSYSNSFDGLTMVANTDYDMSIAGAYNVFSNCQGQSQITFTGIARANVLRSGTYTGDITNSSIYAQWYDRPTLSSSVTLTDAVTLGAERRYWKASTAEWTDA